MQIQSRAPFPVKPARPATVAASDLRKSSQPLPEPTDHFEPGPALRLQQEVRDQVGRVLSQEAHLGPWTARDGMCLDLAAKWQQRLQAAGLEAHLVTVDHNHSGHALTVAGERVPGKFHAFVIVGSGPDPVLVDGSVQQFFGGPDSRPDLPEVLVGGLAEAEELFARHPQDLRLEVAGDPREGLYQPRELARFVYGGGPYASARETLN